MARLEGPHTRLYVVTATPVGWGSVRSDLSSGVDAVSPSSLVVGLPTRQVRGWAEQMGSGIV